MGKQDMLERVARAIHAAGGWAKTWEQLDENLRLDSYREARAAIQSMREPTGAMVQAGRSGATNMQSWMLMVDAALSHHNLTALDDTGEGQASPEP